MFRAQKCEVLNASASARHSSPDNHRSGDTIYDSVGAFSSADRAPEFASEQQNLSASTYDRREAIATNAFHRSTSHSPGNDQGNEEFNYDLVNARFPTIGTHYRDRLASGEDFSRMEAKYSHTKVAFDIPEGVYKANDTLPDIYTMLRDDRAERRKGKPRRKFATPGKGKLSQIKQSLSKMTQRPGSRSQAPGSKARRSIVQVQESVSDNAHLKEFPDQQLPSIVIADKVSEKPIMSGTEANNSVSHRHANSDTQTASLTHVEDFVPAETHSSTRMKRRLRDKGTEDITSKRCKDNAGRQVPTSNPLATISPLQLSEKRIQDVSASPEAVSQESEIVSPSSQPLELQFDSLEQAQEAMANRELEYDWRGPNHDLSLPRNSQAREEYATQLMHAFLDTTRCIEGTDIETLRNTWQELGTKSSPYTKQQIFGVSREMIDTAIRLHIEGPRWTPILDSDKLRQIHETSRNMTFAQRIEALCSLMRLSKSRCEALLARENLHAVVAMPAILVQQTKTNKSQNVKRQGYLELGRAAERNKDDQVVELASRCMGCSGKDDERHGNGGMSEEDLNTSSQPVQQFSYNQEGPLDARNDSFQTDTSTQKHMPVPYGLNLSTQMSQEQETWLEGPYGPSLEPLCNDSNILQSHQTDLQALSTSFDPLDFDPGTHFGGVFDGGPNVEHSPYGGNVSSMYGSCVQPYFKCTSPPAAGYSHVQADQQELQSTVRSEWPSGEIFNALASFTTTREPDMSEDKGTKQ